MKKNIPHLSGKITDHYSCIKYKICSLTLFFPFGKLKCFVILILKKHDLSKFKSSFIK